MRLTKREYDRAKELISHRLRSERLKQIDKFQIYPIEFKHFNPYSAYQLLFHYADHIVIIKKRCAQKLCQIWVKDHWENITLRKARMLNKRWTKPALNR